MMERLFLLALLGIILVVVMRTYRPELAVVCGIVTGVLLLGLLLGEATGVLDTVRRLTEQYQLPVSYLSVLLKLLSIAYLARFGSNLAREAGLLSVAEHLELGGRILLVATALPSIVALLETGIQMLEELL